MQMVAPLRCSEPSMLRPGKARRPDVCAQARHCDVDVYQRYAVGLYRQALFSALRAALRRLTTAPAAAVENNKRTSQRAGKSNARTRLRHSSHHGSRGSHARPDGGHVIAGYTALPGDEENVTAVRRRQACWPAPGSLSVATYPRLMFRCAAARYSAGSDRAVVPSPST